MFSRDAVGPTYFAPDGICLLVRGRAALICAISEGTQYTKKHKNAILIMAPQEYLPIPHIRPEAMSAIGAKARRGGLS